MAGARRRPKAARPEPRDPRLSQHYLHPAAGRALARGVGAFACLGRDDLIVEIGAGTGALTEPLAAHGGRVLAVEIDPELCRRLRRRFAARPLVSVWQGDFLTLELPPEPYKVVANLPFAGSAAMVQRLAFGDAPPAEAWLVVQREAALRFAGRPRREETLLSLELKPAWHVEVVRELRRDDFAPPPSVACALLWLARRARPLVAPAETRLWRDFVATGLTGGAESVRQALRSAFTGREIRRLGRDLGFDPGAAPAALHFDQWLGLFRQLAQDPARGERHALRGAAARVPRRRAR